MRKVVFTEESQYCYARVYKSYVHFRVTQYGDNFSFWCTHGSWGGECDKFGVITKSVIVQHTGQVASNLKKGKYMFFLKNITEDKTCMK